MKIKCRPDDFLVEELTDVVPSSGPFALYRLTKRSMGTPETVAAIQRRWDIDRRRISFGGLKDRHAVAVQHLTIERGPRRRLAQEQFELEYLGQAPHPFGPKDIRGNRFRIVVRDLTGPAARAASSAIDGSARDGLPNYFDDQRFGSLGESGEFVARPWCAGDFERALWLALVEPNEHDRPEDRAQKEILRKHWKDWAACKGALEKSHRRSLVTYLADHPADFRGAFSRIDKDLRSLYLSAFQSRLWNLQLAALLREVLPADALLAMDRKAGELLFFRSLDPAVRDRLRATALPLPSARTRLPEGPDRERLDRVLASEGLQLRSLRIKHPKDSFFSKGDRAALFLPTDLKCAEAEDELYPGRRRMDLSFDLPRGCYATILIKRISL